MSRNVIDEFETMINRKARLLLDLKELEAEITNRAPSVLARAREEDEPVDVDAVLARIGAGAGVDVIKGKDLPLNSGKISTFRGSVTSRVRAKAKKRQRAVVAAASIVFGNLTKVVGI